MKGRQILVQQEQSAGGEKGVEGTQGEHRKSPSLDVRIVIALLKGYQPDAYLQRPWGC